MSSVTERGAERQRRRLDPREAEQILARLVPDDELRRGLASIFAESVTEADSINQGAWEVTLNLDRPFLRHNVGAIFALSYHPSFVSVTIKLDELNSAIRKRVKSLQREVRRFKLLPELRYIELTPKDLMGLWLDIKLSHKAALTLAARGVERSPFYRAHSPGVLDHLAKLLGRGLPRPSYATPEGRRHSVEELVALVQKPYPGWAGFDDARFVADERDYKVKTVEKARAALSKPELSELLSKGEHEEFIKRLDLVGKYNNLLYRGVPMAGDLGILYQPQLDKPSFCVQTFNLLHGDGDSANRLAAYLGWVDANNLPNKWTFPTYFLWACSPETEIFIKPSVAQTALKLVGSEIELGKPSGDIYGEYRELALDLKEELQAYRPQDLTDIQSFLYVASAASGTGTRKFWKVAPEEGGRLWENWQAEGIASIGWSELGDISDLSRAEFDARRDELLGEHPGWKKAGINQVWKFSQIRPGDRIVANGGTTRVLGAGTVTGPYYFVQGAEHGHRLAVEWDDRTLREVNEQGWKRTLLELDLEAYERVTTAPVPVVGGPAGGAGAAFTPAAFALLTQLKANPTRDFYAAHKDEFVREVEDPFQKVFQDVVALLPPAITEYMETARNVFARILKNDWGRGGAWDFYWGALYPKTGRRIEDAQLFLWVNGEKVEWGFYVGHYGTEKSETFRGHAGRHEALVAHIFEGYRGRPLRFHGDSAALPGGPEALGWRRWVSDAPGREIGARVELTAKEVLRTSATQLTADIVQTFKDLFPLVYLTEAKDPTVLVRKYLEEDEPEPRPAALLQPEYPITAMADECAFPAELLSLWVRAIERKRQAILYGPPGTGKTFVARALARHIVGGGDGFAELVQFHPSYAYEDFILGIRPKTLPNGDLTYENTRGRFVEFCDRARERKGKCVLIIDEINRANLSRVFGELMFLLEYRDEELSLAGGVRFKIPKNVNLIGTMNTADRSIALVDHALRRRFAFLRLQPNYDVLTRYHERHAAAFPVDKLVSTLKALNGAINNSHYEVGISFFLSPKLAEDIEHVWRMEIEPYLEEYFFDQESKVNEYRWGKVRERLGLGG